MHTNYAAEQRSFITAVQPPIFNPIFTSLGLSIFTAVLWSLIYSIKSAYYETIFHSIVPTFGFTIGFSYHCTIVDTHCCPIDLTLEPTFEHSNHKTLLKSFDQPKWSSFQPPI